MTVKAMMVKGMMGNPRRRTTVMAMLMTFEVTAMTRKFVRGKPRSGTCGHINAKNVTIFL